MATDTIVRVDPKTLLVGPNVRREAALTKEFVASVQDLGVRIPITAHETPEGLVVIDGQRRTLAAVDAGLADVPVFITDSPSDQVRIIDQYVANQQREGLGQGDALAAVQDLSLFDLKVPAIAKKLGVPRGTVEDAAKIAKSTAAREHYEKHHRTDAAVAIAEFEGQPEQQELLGLAQAWQVAERGRDMVAERDRKVVAAEIDALDGVTLVTRPDGYGDPQPVDHLYFDEKLTQPVEDEDDLDVAALAAIAGDGLVAWPDWIHDGGRRRIGIAYGVKGWKERGLFVPSYYQRTQTKAASPEDAEKLKIERRAARENTKAWVQAAGARFEFLQGLVQRKTMPKGWEALVAARMLNNAGTFSTSQLKAMLTILQLTDTADAYSLRNGIEKLLAKTPARAPQIMLAVELGCCEGAGDFEKKGWAGCYGMPFEQVRKYLRRLVEWGYELSEIEKAVVAGKVKKTA